MNMARTSLISSNISTIPVLTLFNCIRKDLFSFSSFSGYSQCVNP